MAKTNWAEIGRAGADLIGHIIANSELIGRTVARDFAAVKRDAAGAYDATVDDFRELGATFRASPRYWRIATLAASIAARHRFAMARADRLGLGAEAIDEAHRRSAIEVRQACAELGGGVLKVGQLLSSRADLLPPAYIEELSTLQDRAPALPFDEIEPIIAADLGSLESIFETIDHEAIAAASLAQVHSARLIDGRDVVIKAQRPGVADLVRADLRALALLANMFGDALPGIDVDTLVTEVTRFVLGELDFERESERLAQFAKQATDDSRWHVPSVTSFCGPRVIVMERIRGRSLTEHLVNGDEAERARIISLLIELLAKQVLQVGLAHGDPHPGNVMVADDGRLVFVDFGCVLELDTSVRRAYVELVMAILGRNEKAIAAALEHAGFEAANPEALVKMAALFLEAFEDGMLAEIDTREQAMRSLELAREAGDIRVPTSFVLIARIFALVGGLVVHYRPALELGPLLMQALRPDTSNVRCA